MALFGTGVQRICAVVAASTAAEMSKYVLAARRQTRTLELRLDWLRSGAERVRFLAWLKRKKFRDTTFLATCRRREGGGKLDGGVDHELHWLIQAREAGCQWCDVEVETLRKLPGQSIREYPVPQRVMLSFHDFARTPDLPRTVSPPANGGVDAVKIAAEARTIRDSIRLLRLARRSKNFIAAPMGEIGLPARILALREGSALAYAPVAAATAPGQVSLHDMKNLYRAHALTRRTRVDGVIGDPVGHSLSPLLHNTGFVARRVDAVYLIFGAGGAARVAAFALAKAGALVGICDRREKAARELAKAAGGEVVPRRALRSESFDAILNATPIGMHPHDSVSPLAPTEINCRIVMDLIYRPQRTQLLKLAAQKRISTVSGVDMFLAQGIAQWEIWTEKRAPEAPMRRAVLAALSAEETSR